MEQEEQPANIQQLLDRVELAAENRDQVSVGMIVEEVGRRSFGPLLLVAGLMLASPVSGIPGVPTAFGGLVLFVSLQMLFGRRHFWLPQLLLKRAVSRGKLLKALKFLRPPARFIDKGLRPRLKVFVGGPGQNLIAVVCALISVGTPLMELVPFSATTAGVAIALFGLSITAGDGLIAVPAFAFSVMIFWLIQASLYAV